jgi:hypothetical protein
VKFEVSLGLSKVFVRPQTKDFKSLRDVIAVKASDGCHAL